MSLTIYQVDAFTDKPFAGNPAGICILPVPQNEQWMQSVAMEMNLSETAFLLKQPDGYNLRWFTPEVEVDLCGHATLASAHILWETGHLKSDERVRFHSRSGLLLATKKGNWIELDFPAKPEELATAPPELLTAIGVNTKYIGKNQFDYIIEVESEEIVRNLKPNLSLLQNIPVRGVIVTSRSSNPDFDFVSRFFAPGAGVLEDPVTGSAHCCLGPYWKTRLNKSEFVAYQASKRGGSLKVRVDGDRVYLMGQAVTVLRGNFLY